MNVKGKQIAFRSAEQWRENLPVRWKRRAIEKVVFIGMRSNQFVHPLHSFSRLKWWTTQAFTL